MVQLVLSLPSVLKELIDGPVVMKFKPGHVKGNGIGLVVLSDFLPLLLSHRRKDQRLLLIVLQQIDMV